MIIKCVNMKVFKQWLTQNQLSVNIFQGKCMLIVKGSHLHILLPVLEIINQILRFPYSGPVPAMDNYVIWVNHCRSLDHCFVVSKMKVLDSIGGS